MANHTIYPYFYCGKAVSKTGITTMTSSGVIHTRRYTIFDDAMAAVRKAWNDDHPDESADIILLALNPL